MESHRSSIFPPTLGTVSVPSDFSRDYMTKNESTKLKLLKDSYRSKIFEFFWYNEIY